MASVAPYLENERIKVEYVSPETDREMFLREGSVVLRLRGDDPDETNFVHGSFMFVSTILLHGVKRFLSKSHRESIDLFVTAQLLEKEKASVRDLFMDSYLYPKVQDTTSKVADYIDSYTKMDEGGYFYPIFLQELDFLGKKVFGKRQDQVIHSEVNAAIDFLTNLSDRALGIDVELEFCRTYCKFAIVIVGKSVKVTTDGQAWVTYIRKGLIPQQIETIYLVGPEFNQRIIDNVCETLRDKYEVYRTQRATVKIRRVDNEPKVDTEQYAAVLRLRGAPTFQASD